MRNEVRKVIQFGQYRFPDEPIAQSMQVETRVNSESLMMGGAIDLDGFCQNKYDPFSVDVSLYEDFSRFKNPQKLHQYITWLKRQITKKRRLWAVDYDGRLMWAWARVASWNIDVDKSNPVRLTEINFSFIVFTGVWNKADPHNTFIQTEIDCLCEPWNTLCGIGCVRTGCEKTGCDESSNCNTCGDNCADCCSGAYEQKPYCELINRYNFSDLCNNDYRIWYSCGEGQRVWGDLATKGECFDVEGDGTITLCSETDIDTTRIVIRGEGEWTNPRILINNIYGFFGWEDAPRIFPEGWEANSMTGSIRDLSDGCCTSTTDVINLTGPILKFKPGYNNILYRGAGAGAQLCIKHESLTI